MSPSARRVAWLVVEGWQDRLEVSEASLVAVMVLNYLSNTQSTRADSSFTSVIKIVGAAANVGTSFDDLMTLGNALGRSMVSIASTLDHCHVPGRTEHAMLANDEIELGTGPHNEPVCARLIFWTCPVNFG